MCTVIVLYKVLQVYPIVLGMNRDEVISRRCSAPRLVQGNPKIYAPIDEQAGGTWLGVNECGVLAAVLNRVSEKPSDAPPNPRSRGLLCLDALTRHSAAEIRDLIADETSQPRYNKFDLLCMDKANAFLIHYDNSKTIKIEELRPGLHVLVNYHTSEPSSSEASQKLKERSRLRREKALQLFNDFQPHALENAVERLKQTFRDHENGVCQHRTRHDIAEIAGQEFATRSSSIIAIGDLPSLFLHANASPCMAEYQDYSQLFR